MLLYKGKRSSKGLPEPILPDPLITVLIGELDTLVCAIVRYTSVIQRYYIEYLKGAHLTSLRRLIQVGAVSGYLTKRSDARQFDACPFVVFIFIFFGLGCARSGQKVEAALRTVAGFSRRPRLRFRSKTMTAERVPRTAIAH